MAKGGRLQSAAGSGAANAQQSASPCASAPFDDLDQILEMLAAALPRLQAVAIALRARDSSQKEALDAKDQRIAQLEELVQEANARDQRSRLIHEEFEKRLEPTLAGRTVRQLDQ